MQLRTELELLIVLVKLYNNPASLERSLNISKVLSIPDFGDAHTKAFLQSKVAAFRDIAVGHGNHFAYTTSSSYNVSIDCRAYFSYCLKVYSIFFKLVFSGRI